MVREPEPFTVVVLAGFADELEARSFELPGGEGFSQGRGDREIGRWRDREVDVLFERAHFGVGHFVEFHGDVRDYAQETECAGCCTELGWVIDELEVAVAVDVFDFADEVAEGLVLNPTALDSVSLGSEISVVNGGVTWQIGTFDPPSVISTITTFSGSVHASPRIDHRRSSSFVTAAPILTSRFCPPEPATSSPRVIALNSLDALEASSGRIEDGSGTALAVLRSSIETKTSLSSE